MIKSLKTLRVNMLRRLGLSEQEGGGGGGGLLALNTTQLGLARICKCKMHVLWQAFAKLNVLLQKYLGFASFCKYDCPGFSQA